MFVEKIILEELHGDGRILTTIVQSSLGKPMLLDYAEQLDVPGAQYGPYTIIQRNKNALQELISRFNPFDRPFHEESFEGRLSGHRFQSLGESVFAIQQEWHNIPVNPQGGSGMVYALRLPKYANIDDLRLDGDVHEQSVIRDRRFDAYFISFVLRPEWNTYAQRANDHASFRLVCQFTIAEERFTNHAYDGDYSDKYTNEFNQPTVQPRRR